MVLVSFIRPVRIWEEKGKKKKKKEGEGTCYCRAKDSGPDRELKLAAGAGVKARELAKELENSMKLAIRADVCEVSQEDGRRSCGVAKT